MDDPAFDDISDPASLQKYSYAANDPVDGSDPSGNSLLEYTWFNNVNNRVYILAIHGAHHPFVYPILGNAVVCSPATDKLHSGS